MNDPKQETCQLQSNDLLVMVKKMFNKSDNVTKDFLVSCASVSVNDPWNVTNQTSESSVPSALTTIEPVVQNIVYFHLN